MFYFLEISFRFGIGVNNEDDVTLSVLLDSRFFHKTSDFTLFELKNVLEIVTGKQFRN